MNRKNPKKVGLVGLAGAMLVAIAPSLARADVSLLQAEVTNFRNRVELLLNGGPLRPVRDRDRLGFGDTILTYQASQADLRFNDGSFSRLGEQTTFWFVPNTRDLRLTGGTALMFPPPDRRTTTLETPNVRVDMQDAAIVVRHIPAAEAPDSTLGTAAALRMNTGRTAVLVLTKGPQGSATVNLPDGRSFALSVGEMAIVNNADLYLFAFDLALFYQTSPLLQPTEINGQTANASDRPIALIRQQMQATIVSQESFASEYVLDPNFLNLDGALPPNSGWLFPAASPEAPPPNPATPPPEVPSQRARPHESDSDSIELQPSPSDDSAPEDQAPLREGNERDLPPGLLTPSPPAEEIPSDQLPGQDGNAVPETLNEPPVNGETPETDPRAD